MNQIQIPACEVFVNGLSHAEPFKEQAQKTAREISESLGPYTEIKVALDPVSKSKKLYHLSLLVDVDRERFAISKEGKKVYSLLRKAKRAALRQVRSHKKKIIKNKRRSSDRWNWDCFGVAS